MELFLKVVDNERRNISSSLVFAFIFPKRTGSAFLIDDGIDSFVSIAGGGN